jgi:hypothetical protein
MLRNPAFLLMLLICGLIMALPGATRSAQAKNNLAGPQNEKIYVFLAPMVFHANGSFSIAQDGQKLAKGEHVKVSITVFGEKSLVLNLERDCWYEHQTKRKGHSSVQKGRDTDSKIKEVTENGVLLSWRQLTPRKGGTCRLNIRSGEVTFKTFTVHME